MTIDELHIALSKVFPNGFALDEDNYGQVVIYTDLMCDENDNLVPFEEECE